MRITPESLYASLRGISAEAVRIGETAELLKTEVEKDLLLVDANYDDMEQKCLSLQMMHLALCKVRKFLERQTERYK